MPFKDAHFILWIVMGIIVLNGISTAVAAVFYFSWLSGVKFAVVLVFIEVLFFVKVSFIKDKYHLTTCFGLTQLLASSIILVLTTVWIVYEYITDYPDRHKFLFNYMMISLFILSLCIVLMMIWYCYTENRDKPRLQPQRSFERRVYVNEIEPDVVQPPRVVYFTQSSLV